MRKRASKWCGMKRKLELQHRTSIRMNVKINILYSNKKKRYDSRCIFRYASLRIGTSHGLTGN